MFAVLKTGGKQYKVASGDVLRVGAPGVRSNLISYVDTKSWAGFPLEETDAAKAQQWLAKYEAPPIDAGLDEALLDFIARRSREIPA